MSARFQADRLTPNSPPNLGGEFGCRLLLSRNRSAVVFIMQQNKPVDVVIAGGGFVGLTSGFGKKKRSDAPKPPSS